MFQSLCHDEHHQQKKISARNLNLLNSFLQFLISGLQIHILLYLKYVFMAPNGFHNQFYTN